ncbi:hypothetical protein [Streptomyces sp. IBSBF 2435]|uniref:hypothetical protein n=1 Tax=Streptomyces sp. IBSBF 2435 TaxID=2903531 RepID=UPI002FDC5337
MHRQQAGHDLNTSLDNVDFPVTGARQGAPVAASRHGHPVVPFSPGFGAMRELCTALVEDLAGHGSPSNAPTSAPSSTSTCAARTITCCPSRPRGIRTSGSRAGPESHARPRGAPNGCRAPFARRTGTGTGDYATANDLGVAWTTRRTPLVLAVRSTKAAKDAPADEALLADTARVLARTLAPGE